MMSRFHKCHTLRPFHKTVFIALITRCSSYAFTHGHGPVPSGRKTSLCGCRVPLLRYSQRVFSESQRRERGRSNIVISHSSYDIGNMFYLFQQTTFCPMLWPSLSPEPDPTCATALRLKQNATTIPLAESQSHPSPPI